MITARANKGTLPAHGAGRHSLNDNLNNNLINYGKLTYSMD